MGKVAVLPAEVQGQIAAGEVIERPASIVKELVENALDAGARHVEVRLVDGGIGGVTVIDDGEGMAPDDAVLAFARHATSKLRSADDLGTVTTLGFRGEALPSIAAAGHVRLVTRRRADDAAIAVEADGTGARAAGPAGAAAGTTVHVTELFATTPARRKFLRAPATEAGQVVDVVTRLAVAHPGTGFRVVSERRELLAHPPVATVAQRLAQVLGTARAAALVPVSASAGPFALSGFLGPPREHAASARLCWTFVGLRHDDRPHEDSPHEDSPHEDSPYDERPHGGDARDVAPGASGLRWVRDRVLLRAIQDGYESLLPRGRYPVAVLFLRAAPGEMDVNVHPAKLEVRFHRTQPVHQLVAGALRSRLRAALAPPAATAGGPAGAAPGAAPFAAAVPTASEGAAEPAAAYGGVPAIRFGTQGALWQPAAHGFAPLRFVGQLFDGYLLCEHDGQALLIDQHAAHERVLFERLVAEDAAAGIVRDPLLVPEPVAMAPAEVATLAEHAPLLAAAGLEGEPFGEETFLVRTVPRLLRDTAVGGIVRAVAADLEEGGASDAVARAVHRVLATVACHAAVRVGQRLDAAQVQALLDAMDASPVNAHCPHGRPVAVALRRTAIEALFQR